MDKTKHKTPPMRIDNQGRELFTLQCIVDAQRRPLPQQPVVIQPQNQDAPAGEGSAATTGERGGEPGAEPNPADGLVRDRWRLISMVVAWPSSDYWLPQRVNYAYANGQALREIPGLVNSLHPDLVWSHWGDATGIAGHVEAAEWEESTDIPPGVNAMLVVDPAFDRKMAVGLQRGQIRNGSIGIRCECERSHPQLAIDAFLELQGEEIGGRIVEWWPIHTNKVEHFAACPAQTGGDPNAARRNERTELNVAASAATQTSTGGNRMDKALLSIVQMVCGSLNIEAMLAEGEPVPAGLLEWVQTRLNSQATAILKYNELVAEVGKLQPFLLREGETGITTTTILDRAPALLKMAPLGEKFIEHQRAEALRWFDAAKVEKDASALTDAQKRQRERIAGSMDLDLLADTIEECRNEAEKRFGPQRSSKGQEIPTETVKATERLGHERDIADGVAQLYRKEGS